MPPPRPGRLRPLRARAVGDQRSPPQLVALARPGRPDRQPDAAVRGPVDDGRSGGQGGRQRPARANRAGPLPPGRAGAAQEELVRRQIPHVQVTASAAEQLRSPGASGLAPPGGPRGPTPTPDERLLVICGSTVLVMAGQGVVGPVLPLFARDFGVGAAVVGLTFTAFGLARLVLNIPAGLWADRRGRRFLLVGGPPDHLDRDDRLRPGPVDLGAAGVAPGGRGRFGAVHDRSPDLPHRHRRAPPAGPLHRHQPGGAPGRGQRRAGHRWRPGRWVRPAGPVPGRRGGGHHDRRLRLVPAARDQGSGGGRGRGRDQSDVAGRAASLLPVALVPGRRAHRGRHLLDQGIPPDPGAALRQRRVRVWGPARSGCCSPGWASSGSS